MTLRIGLFVDAQNVQTSSYALFQRPSIDYTALERYLAGEGRIAVKVLVRSNVGEHERFVHAMLNLGYRVILPQDGNLAGTGKLKDRSDIILTIEVVKVAPLLDMIVLVSGDGDFVPLVQHLVGLGKIVWVAGFSGMTSRELIQSCHRFVDLARVSGFISERLETGPLTLRDDDCVYSVQAVSMDRPDLADALQEVLRSLPAVQPEHAGLFKAYEVIEQIVPQVTAPILLSEAINAMRERSSQRLVSLPGANIMATVATVLQLKAPFPLQMGLAGTSYYLYPAGQRPGMMVGINTKAVARDTLAMVMLPERADSLIAHLLGDPDSCKLTNYQTREPYHLDNRWFPPRDAINRIASILSVYIAHGLPADFQPFADFLHRVRRAVVRRWVEVADAPLREKLARLLAVPTVNLWPEDYPLPKGMLVEA